MAWLDVSGSIDFTLFGTVAPSFVDGPAGQALELDGVDQYAKGSGVDGGDAMALQSLWTIQGWMNWPDIGAPSIRNSIGYFADPLATGGVAADHIQFMIQLLPINTARWSIMLTRPTLLSYAYGHPTNHAVNISWRHFFTPAVLNSPLRREPAF